MVGLPLRNKWLIQMTGAYVGQIGSPGRNAGQLHWIDASAMDSLGNIYTGEVDDGKFVRFGFSALGLSTEPQRRRAFKCSP
jgi:hypothetical protein